MKWMTFPRYTACLPRASRKYTFLEGSRSCSTHTCRVDTHKRFRRFSVKFDHLRQQHYRVRLESVEPAKQVQENEFPLFFSEYKREQ